ncbi:MAG: ABC transporter substrate-binding protein [Deinococcota bacterium]|nr:ABC transporter substrate-binding protein [Deinococcota bacterium]
MAAVVPVIFSILAALAFAASSLADAQNRLIIGESAEAVGLDPRVQNDVPSFTRMQTIMEPLVTFSTDMEVIPRLAESWQIGEDGLSLTFALRQGVLFHHGQELTAEDVVYTFDWVLDEANNSVHRSLYADITAVEAVDDYTVRMELQAPNAFVLNNVALMPIVPRDADERDFDRQPVGTGPLVFESWTRDDRMVLRAFPDYWGGRPQIDEVEFRPIPEDTARLLAFEAGEIDLYQGRVVPSEVESLEANPDIGVQRVPGLTYTYVGFNQEVEPLDDVRVREAIAHLIPREAVVERVMQGTAEVAISPFSSGSPWYYPGVPRFDYDPERARELLAEAGLEAGGLSLSIYTNQNPVREQVAEILQAELSQLGIELTVTIEEWGAFLSRVQDSDDYDLFILGWSRNVDPDRAIARQFSREGGSNFTHYQNDRVDELLERGRSLPLYDEEQMAIYHEVQEIIVGDVPYAFIMYEQEIGVYHDTISGWQVHPYNTATYQDIHLIGKDR